MKTEDEIYQAHDLLDPILRGEFPELIFKDEKDHLIMNVAFDVLCWVLDHDDTVFQHNLAAFTKAVEAAGYERYEAYSHDAAPEPAHD